MLPDVPTAVAIAFAFAAATCPAALIVLAAVAMDYSYLIGHASEIFAAPPLAG